jgi:hypothetical protein
MSEPRGLPDFGAPIVNHARKDFPLLDAGMSVADALERKLAESPGVETFTIEAGVASSPTPASG